MPVKARDYLRIAEDCVRTAAALPAGGERDELVAMAGRLRAEAVRVALRTPPGLVRR